jgi:ribosome-binding ATPase YchF (GTP1/OBG family)
MHPSVALHFLSQNTVPACLWLFVIGELTQAACCFVQVEEGALNRIMENLDKNIPARAVQLTDDEAALVKGLQLLTMKPMIYAANVSENDLADQGASNAHVQALQSKAAQDNCEVIIVSAQVCRDAYK